VVAALVAECGHVARRRRLGLQAAGLVGAAAVGVAVWRLTGSSLAYYRGGCLAVTVAVAIVIAAASDPAGPVARLLGFRWLRGLGVISYGVYLWHWPVVQVLTADRTGERGPALLGIRVGVTAAFAG